MNMHERINTGEFNAEDRRNNVPLPPREDQDREFIKIDNQIAYAKSLLNTAQNARKDLRRKRREAHRDAEAATVIRFRAALEEEFGMTDHPKRAAIWTNAWDRGHSNGFQEVASEYEDLVDLIK